LEIICWRLGMEVTRLQVNNFRNYASSVVEFGAGTNILVGKNAQGKTNLVEAVLMCSVGRSSRTPRDKELIKWEERRARIKAFTQKREGLGSVEIVIDREENKRVAINGLPVSKMGELMGNLSTVFFSPDELKIVKSSPADRRRFMDITLCQLSKTYFYLLSSYNKVLAQRNKLLKSGDVSAIEIWDEQLATYGAKIARTRRGFIDRLAVHAKKTHEYLTGGVESLDLSYLGIEGKEVEEIKDNIIFELIRSREKDFKNGYTNVGIQKDDIMISSGGVDLRTYGSQGQQRTAALSLKLAEISIMKDETDEYPVLLLDDVLSELDTDRQKKLLGAVKGFQTIITCTHLPKELTDTLKDFSLFNVVSGKVTKAQAKREQNGGD